MSDRPTPVPVWWKNTFFWIAGLLFIVGVIGLPFVKGPEAIRDPGQIREGGLTLIYFGGALIMLVNGWLSHRQAINHYVEQEGELPSKKDKALGADGPGPVAIPQSTKNRESERAE